jgi:hypothetical protein
VSGARHRPKGDRVGRALIDRHKPVGVHAERYPLSANRFRGRGPDAFDGPVNIERLITKDDQNGPRPPDGDGWTLVQGFDGQSLWRRLSLINRGARALRGRN